MHIICLLPKCAFQDISKFQPSSEEDWKESYKYGVSTKGWKETLQIYKELAHIRDFPQITGKNRKKWIKNTLSIMIRSILQFMAEILLVLGLLSFLRNSEIAYRVRANGEAAKKSFTDTLTMFGEILTHADNITISIFMVCACVVLLPFLILVPLKLDGSIKLHFGFCIASVIAPLIIADFLWVPQLSVSDSLKLERGWEWEERRSGYSFAIQKFEWLRMKLGLTKFAENETVVGFAEFTETDEREPGRGIWPTGRPKKSSWKDYDAIEKALKMRKDFYAKFEALERNWWTCFAKKEETFAVNLTRLLESNISKRQRFNFVGFEIGIFSLLSNVTPKTWLDVKNVCLNITQSFLYLQSSAMKNIKIHPLRLFATSCSYASVQLSFGFTFALFSPMITKLGIETWLGSVIWLLGPICGLLQPFIGAYSDKANFKWGRRRPFILAGLFIVSISFALFILITEEVIAFVLIYVSINMLMLPARAIIFDVCGEGQESLGNNFIALLIGVGNLLSYIFAALVLKPYYYGLVLILICSIPTLIFAPEKRYIRILNEKVDNPFITALKAVKNVFKGGPVLCASFAFLLSWCAYFSFNSSATLFVADVVYRGIEEGRCDRNLTMENRANAIVLSSPTPSASLSISNASPFSSVSFKTFLKLANSIMYFRIPLHSSPSVMPTTNFISLRSFISYSSYSSSSSSSSNITDTFAAGQMMGSFAMIALSGITSIFSLLSTKLQTLLGPRCVYVLSQLIATIALFCLFFPTHMDTQFVFLIFIAYSLLGISFSAFNSIPFALVSSVVKEKEAGVTAGVMNLFCMAGQMMSLGLSAVVTYFTEKAVDECGEVGGRRPLQWCFLGECGVSAIATVAVFVLLKAEKTRENGSQREKDGSKSFEMSVSGSLKQGRCELGDIKDEVDDYKDEEKEKWRGIEGESAERKGLIEPNDKNGEGAGNQEINGIQKKKKNKSALTPGKWSIGMKNLNMEEFESSTKSIPVPSGNEAKGSKNESANLEAGRSG
ncbi:putative solute carrier family 45, member 1/2/4 [Monocercomonoides exilis]|uniref:putative solute carrier family 45, member 1/2/4 n=1 Tax=Monocercomonoides exilis TaxID=2049356 RepID=UPI003559ED86|nr:putative solute carrier family 45, member 1/2/4 [Monocercomonoides exilis]|eukprot:MONOS_6758.2-p1 / transcript=MONOS_6758.2 / gene=MONOS_6758 / organism=Monocercomonoides_exilis_PA203 / gene_product=Glycoside-Pentoside-Hexuronide(GPH):CationSymporterFamilyProtein / transcript_product=Glycoside-Pentoside-Hexuronide(GPH):CationSymporterFamilyProtein / location=Mono_scaffold00219:874-5348(+) / protein_length=1009 / sequence_SO=supercontig / SO=protein_coding / is_pseudo=false